MPKKSKDGGESKKRRASASTKDRSSSTTSPSTDVLLPPTPTATHLVASNPFDDPPSNNVNVPGPVLHGQSHFPMHSPMHNSGMGSPTSMQMGSPWGPNAMGPAHRGIRPYGSPSGPNWNPNAGEMMSPTNSHMLSPYQGMPMHQQQGMSPTGYTGYNRPMMSHPGMPNRHPGPYHGPPGGPGNRFGEMSPERMPMSRMPMHMHGNNHSMHMAAANQMKILTRPAGPMSQANPPTQSGRKSSSSSKSDLKFSRGDTGGTTPKSKKKSKASEAKANKMSNNDSEEKKSNMSRITQKSHTSSPITSTATPPHKIPPVLPQACVKCGQDISLEDCVCCLASCHRWYHRTCSGLTLEAIDCLRAEELALWACDNCVCTKEINSVRLREKIDTEGHQAIIGKA